MGRGGTGHRVPCRGVRPIGRWVRGSPSAGARLPPPRRTCTHLLGAQARAGQQLRT